MGQSGTIRKEKRVVVTEDGHYLVQGRVPLVSKIQVVSEYGEPLTWRKAESWDVGETYILCRCGQSSEMPFCDGTHRAINFDGKETADTGATADRQEPLPGGTHILVKCDESLCMNAGFCANRATDIEHLVRDTDDTAVRSQVIAMIERCPSGSLTYTVAEGQADIEPDLPQQVAVVTEMTSQGPIDGPLWVTGGVPVERADGLSFETRNRVTLCRCGRSRNKPLCDGTHRPPDPNSCQPGQTAVGES